MNECCDNTQSCKDYPRSYQCPVNGKTYASVKLKTVLHHVQQPWQKNLPQQAYFFCTDPDCDVVYFGQDNTLVHVNEVRTSLWQKHQQADDYICHCFGVTSAQAAANTQIKEFVVEQTKNSNCSCETSNPSGKCCLQDFSKH